MYDIDNKYGLKIMKQIFRKMHLMELTVISTTKQTIKAQKRYLITAILCICLIHIIGEIIPSFAKTENNGITLFKQEKYLLAVSTLSKELITHPADPDINYFMGRSLLAINRVDKAIIYLKEATKLSQDIPDYYFWLGVGYWANMEFENEKESYLKALKIEPDHLTANLYLGHNYMDRNKWKAALSQYDRVLDIDPYVPEALYNRALVFRYLKEKKNEKKAWLFYLNKYNYGKWALRATEALNGYGDFSYRIYLLGPRKIVAPAIEFEQGGSILKPNSMPVFQHLIKKIGNNMDYLIHVIAYVKGNHNIAKSRAIAIKAQILGAFPTIEASSVMVSWFDISEKIITNGQTYYLTESIDVISVKK